MSDTAQDLQAAPQSDEEQITAGHYVVALIDIMGQSAELAKWNYTPNQANPQPEWVEALRNTRGRVLLWRNFFNTHFQKTAERMDQQAEFYRKIIPVSKQERFEQYRTNEVSAAHFSDSIIFFSPLQNTYGFMQTSNIYSMLGALGTLFLIGLSEKTVFRGAIEVGMLCNLPTGEPYGPALADAHRLESTCADYPRILVGETLLRYLTDVEKMTNQDGPSKANRSIAEGCRRFITQDEDEKWIVDYLGEAFASLGRKPEKRAEATRRAYEFVEAELDRFKKEGNQKLVDRYERLAAYFRAHLSK